MTVRFLALYETPTGSFLISRYSRWLASAIRAERLGGPRLGVDQQGILHLWLLPAGYLVVSMTNGACPGGQ